jgi:hypothetical protein
MANQVQAKGLSGAPSPKPRASASVADRATAAASGESLATAKAPSSRTTAASTSSAVRLKRASALPGAPHSKSLDKAAKAFANFNLSRFPKDKLPANYVDRTKIKDPAAVQGQQRKVITEQLEKLPKANTQNPGMTLSFPLRQLGELKKALPGITDEGGEVELGDLLQYLRGRTNGTDFYSSGNPVVRRLTTETRFRSQARAVVDSIKSRTSAPVSESKTAENTNASQNPAPSNSRGPKS